MNNLIESVFSMKMDVYHQTEMQDPDTGAIKREWNYIKTLSCHAKSIISNSATGANGNFQAFRDKYINEQVIVVRTAERLNFREKVTNIRDSSNTPIWTELDYPSDTPTVFEVIGVTPLTDPFGSVLAYNSVMKRSENQQIGI